MFELGYRNRLYILPFDHRGSFQEKLFGIKGRQPNEAETQMIASYKRVIYEGYLRAVQAGLSKAESGILVDEQFGSEIIKDALKHGVSVSVPAEKSGQDEFDFEYGSQFREHIESIQPSFVKVLVRLNPQSAEELNRRQIERLRTLSDYVHQTGRKYMFELLVPATESQLHQCHGSVATFDEQLRPKLMLDAMALLQSSGVEPDVWKLEGIETQSDCQKVSAQARQGAGHWGSRQNVGVIILGRGENAEKVNSWLESAARSKGFIGFAVGRTVFWDALKAMKEGQLTRDQTAQKIADQYLHFCQVWTSSTPKE